MDTIAVSVRECRVAGQWVSVGVRVITVITAKVGTDEPITVGVSIRCCFGCGVGARLRRDACCTGFYGKSTRGTWGEFATTSGEVSKAKPDMRHGYSVRLQTRNVINCRFLCTAWAL